MGGWTQAEVSEVLEAIPWLSMSRAYDALIGDARNVMDNNAKLMVGASLPAGVTVRDPQSVLADVRKARGKK